MCVAPYYGHVPGMDMTDGTVLREKKCTIYYLNLIMVELGFRIVIYIYVLQFIILLLFPFLFLLIKRMDFTMNKPVKYIFSDVMPSNRNRNIL